MIEKILEKMEELRNIDICAGITCAECEKMCGKGDCSKNYQFLTINKCKEIVQEVAKEYEVKTVIHGHWKNFEPYRASDGSGRYLKGQQCSECGAYFASNGNTPYSNHPYCCQCGAKMDAPPQKGE